VVVAPLVNRLVVASKVEFPKDNHANLVLILAEED
jgi:hypothetical protein